MEAKIIVNLVISAEDFEKTEKGRMEIISGYFYFQGQKYTIVNKEIYHDKAISA